VLRTPLCDLLGIDVPIVQASLGPWSSVELTAAVSEAGALGSFGTAMRPADAVRRALEEIRARTDRPFAANFTSRPLEEDAFAAALALRPPVVSHALGFPGDLVRRAHEAGALFVQQVHSVEQALAAAEAGADAIIAQGGDAGGFGETVGTMALVPQVVDAVSPLPVVAAGGIGDGRGVAAALMLGAQGANVGTRFLASAESAASDGLKRRLVEAGSEEAVKVEFADAVFPVPAGGYPTRPRVLRTPFVDEWNTRLEEAPGEGERLAGQLRGAGAEGRLDEYIPFAGQSAGLVREILPAAVIVRRLVAEAEDALRTALSAVR
jgi:nitronate monooxygenase/enoyl-[acyl-carrier protein] reductase II